MSEPRYARPRGAPRKIKLTDRQWGVLRLTAEGHGANAVAALMGFQNITRVKRIKAGIKIALGLRTDVTSEVMVAEARRRNLIP